MITRRTFLTDMALITAGLMVPPTGFSLNRDKWGDVLPLRMLGSTGENVTMLGVGGYHVGWTTEKDAQDVIETAIELGIRFFDTANNYGKGLSESRYGKYLIPKYRDQIFLMTKTQAPDYKTAKKEIEHSLSRMKVDQVDLLQMHSLKDPDDVDYRVNNGVIKALDEAIKEKKVKYIGFTCHQNPAAMLRMLEHIEGNTLFSTAQMPINVVDAISDQSFIADVLPKLIDKKIGVFAMKTLADGRFFKHKQVNEKVIWTTNNPVVPDRISIEEAMQFAWSLPISCLITGAENAGLLREKVAFAKKLVTLPAEERTALVQKIANYDLKQKVEYYKKT
jgi:aryl-alcohol dehydrogenase-like predicted oxidoreductase